MREKLKSIAIVTPGAMLHAEYVRSLVDTMNFARGLGIDVRWFNGKSSLVGQARESAVRGYEYAPGSTNPTVLLGWDYDVMVWIDSDTGWSTEAFMQLANSPHDVTCGGYLDTRGNVVAHTAAWPCGIPRDVANKMDDYQQVQSFGFGFVAMKRGVFERIPMPWFSHELVKIGDRDGTPVLAQAGEDISWCVKATRAGIELIFDPQVRVIHYKQQALSY